jgi:translation initiation factor 6
LTIQRVSLFGTDVIGVFAFANDKIGLVPIGTPRSFKELMASVLKVEVYETEVAKSSLIGVMIAGNNNGILLPKTIEVRELSFFKSLGINIEVLPSRSIALGNVILANDKGALVAPDIEENLISVVEDVLGVEEVMRGTISKMITVGSVGVVTNKGGIVHADTGEEELKTLSDLFRVKIVAGTVNFGTIYLRSGIIANTKGALIGNSTTGPEIVRIQEALGVE